MPVVKNPLFSELRGKIKSLEFRTRKNGKIELSMKRVPSYTRTTKQDKIRTRYGQLVQEWKQLTDEEKQEYNRQASKYRISGWNYFVMTKITVTGLSFDNSGGEIWNLYINIPITLAPTEYAQYRIELNGDTISIYSADGTLKTSGSGMLDFWNNVKSDGSDIRAFDNNKNQLYFYIESFDYTNKQATIWVKVEAGSTELNIAYGNAAATESAYNNPHQTFEFFDDFEDADISDWKFKSGTWAATTEAAYKGNYGLEETKITPPAGWGYSQTTFSLSGAVLEYYVRQTEAAGGNGLILLSAWNEGSPNGYLLWINPAGDTLSIYRTDAGTNTLLESATFTSAYGTWYKLKLVIKPDGTIEGYANNQLIVTTTDTNYQTLTNVGVRIARAVQYDEIKVYKPADPASFGTPQIVTT